MQYVYHDDVDYGEFTPIIKKRESSWLGLIQRFNDSKGLDTWTEKEIEDVIQDIQEYILLDYPENKQHTVRQLRDALDGVCRVTLMLFRAYQRLDKEFDCDYSSRKLLSVLLDLQPKTIMPINDSTNQKIRKLTPRIIINGANK